MNSIKAGDKLGSRGKDLRASLSSISGPAVAPTRRQAAPDRAVFRNELLETMLRWQQEHGGASLLLPPALPLIRKAVVLRPKERRVSGGSKLNDWQHFAKVDFRSSGLAERLIAVHGFCREYPDVPVGDHLPTPAKLGRLILGAEAIPRPVLASFGRLLLTIAQAMERSGVKLLMLHDLETKGVPPPKSKSRLPGQLRGLGLQVGWALPVAEG